MSNRKNGTALPSTSIAAYALASAAACGGPQAVSHSSREDAKEQLLGAWRLAALDEPGPDGELHKIDCTGLLVFTRDGHMAVQVMYRDRGAGPGGSPYAQDGYEASFGSYELDADGRTFTYHVEGALVRSLIAQAQPRAFELTEGRLVVKSSNASERWRVVWER